MRTLIRSGLVVTGSSSGVADVLVEDERVMAVAAPGSQPWGADRVIDAAGMYVLPGAVDVHTHFELPVSGTVSSDTWASGSRAAALGGTTTVVDYAGQERGRPLREGVEVWAKRAEGQSCVDYGFHLMVVDVNPATLAEIPQLVDEGISSFKLFTAYPGTNYSDDGRLLEAMFAAAACGATILMHAENGIAIDVLRERAAAAGRLAPIHHLLTRPPSLEAEAVHRVAALAEIAGCTLGIVHISSADALAEVVAARGRGVPVIAETCPQYLALGLEDVPPGDDAATYVCSPPLRPRADGHQERLWSAVASGPVDVVATDHCPFTRAQKSAGFADFRQIPNGLGTVEHRLDLLHQGVLDGRLSLTRMVAVASEAPARAAGLFPRKGTIAPGSDADLVVYDPTTEHTLGVADHHMATDVSAWEGVAVTGRARTVLVRGAVVVEDGRFVGRPGHGRFLRRGRDQPLAAR